MGLGLPHQCPKSESPRKRLGEGAKGLLDPASKRPLALLGDLCSLGPEGVKKTLCALAEPLLEAFPFWAISQVHSIPSLEIGSAILAKRFRQLRFPDPFPFVHCDPAGLLQSPKTPESRKYEKRKSHNPTQGGLAPENPKEMRQKRAKKWNCWPVFVPFFGIFLLDFRGPTLDGGFCIRISGLLWFLGSVPGPQGRRESKRKAGPEFCIDPASSIRTSIADPVFADPVSKTQVFLRARKSHQENP